ncbi:uncharacterized protein LOC115720125 [Cannabis sativa]|uniref:uncharacterized protein LOC115720125 n=1 Tax=Cannabis sativa TaxID=3483 RepID=UPI0029CA35C6|nr:uncharacterized protein LOC115720125 [Cannabis sativa]
MDNPPSDDDYDKWGEAVGLDDDHTNAFGDMVDGPTEVGAGKKNVRGACVNKVLQKYRAEGKKMEVEYNMWGQPINESGDIQVSTNGAYVRRNIPLKYNDWLKVPKFYKDRLWNYIESSFDIGGETRASILKTAGELLKSWRTKLTSQLIYKYKDEAPELLEHPPKHYLSCYDEKQWKSFVASRLTPEWEKKRAKAQAIRAKNMYNHRTGRGGAKKVETEMEKELGHQLTEFDRSDIWMRMHTNKKGEIEGPTKEVADRIVEYRKQVEEGTLVEEGKKDILSLALGTDEHAGRVRGMGRGVTQTQFFKTPCPRRKNESRDNSRIAELERRLSQYEEQMNELLQAFRSQQSNTCGTSHASGSAVGGASNEPPTVSRAYSPPPPSAQFVKASARPHAPLMGASAPPPVPPLRASTPPQRLLSRHLLHAQRLLSRHLRHA